MMSATLIAAAVLVFSGIEVTVFVKVTAVGGKFWLFDGAYTQSWGWSLSPPPFSFTTYKLPSRSMVTPSLVWSATDNGLPGSETIVSVLETFPLRSMLIIWPDSWLIMSR